MSVILLLKTQEMNGRKVTEQESLLVEVFDYINAVQVSTVVCMMMIRAILTIIQFLREFLPRNFWNLILMDLHKVLWIQKIY